MLTLKQFLSIELKTRLQLLEWRDSPLLELTIDRQLELLKEIKILLTLSDCQKHKKEKIYVRKFLGHQLAFSKFLERERKKVFGNVIQSSDLTDLTAIDKNLSLSDDSNLLYQKLFQNFSRYLSKNNKKFDLVFLFQFLFTQKGFLLIGIFTIIFVLSSNKEVSNFVRDLLPNDHLSPVELSKLESEVKNNFFTAFNVLYAALQYILYPRYISWLSSSKNEIDGFKRMLEVFLCIVSFYFIFRIIFYLVLGSIGY